MILDVYIRNVKSDGFDFDIPGDYNGYMPKPACEMERPWPTYAGERDLFWAVLRTSNVRRLDWGCHAVVRVSDIPKERITRIVVQKTWPIVERTIDMTTNTISATVRVRSYNRWEKTYKYSGLTVAIDELCRSDLRKVAKTEDLSVGGFSEHIDIYTGEKVAFSGYLYHRDSESTAGNLKCKGVFLPDIEPVWLDVVLTEVETKMCDE